jgi:subtilase family serine protease
MRIRLSTSLVVLGLLLALGYVAPCQGSGPQTGDRHELIGSMPAASALERTLGPLSGTNSLRLTISLPLRNSDALVNLLQRLYDPASPDYRHYLTPAQFTDRFGPTAGEYGRVINFAQSNGLSIVSTHDSRLLLDVRGQASEVEKAFHVKLRNYKHPAESRQFYAPESVPWVDSALPIKDVAGLSDYALLRRAKHVKRLGAHPDSAGGSAPINGDYLGQDFRNAYAPGTSLTGAAQMVGLFEADGYYAVDIANYEAYMNLPPVPLTNVLIDGVTGAPGELNAEVATDIEMSIAMAPGLAAVVVFESSNNVSTWIDILDSMASSNQIKQFSSSWGYTTTNASVDPNAAFDQIFMRMAAQGQSFFQASGDGDAWVSPIWVPADSPYVTSVGGTSLAMTGPGTAYLSETVWNSGFGPPGWPITDNGYWGSGGGISTVYPIPYWQQGVSMTINQGSITNRNIPDVALTATNIFITADNGDSGDYFGTSCSAPLWAGFAALVNQQAAESNKPPAGFLNPAIYALGQGPNYALCFHDITTGSNTSGSSPSNFFAAPGYDLCTGWGTPAGSNLINALAGIYQPSITTQPASQNNSAGSAVIFSVTATGAAPLTYQWQFNGTNIAGATNTSLSVTNLVQTDNGSYSITITNQWGSLTSSVAVLTVIEAATTVTWAAQSPITYGAAITTNQLDAVANVPGAFTYSPTNGTVLNAGTNALSVVFTPTDTADYNSLTNTVSLIVLPATLMVAAASSSRAYGQPNPPFAGTITGVTNGDKITAVYSTTATSGSPLGNYSITPSLVDPNDRQTNYLVALVDGTLTILQATPVVTWSNPPPINYGTALTSNQLNAAANVPGSFMYSPTNGAVLNAGTNTLSLVFRAADNVDYASVTNLVNLLVSPAPLTVTATSYSRQFGAANPDFTGTITGVTNGDEITAAYSCAATASSPQGSYSIVPSLTDPNDRQTNYMVTLVAGLLVVGHPAETFMWTNPAPIVYGAPLSDVQLNAAADVLGTYSYAPTNGSVLNTGTNTLSVIFTPADTINYNSVTDTVSLIVTPSPLTITANSTNRLYGQTNKIFNGTVIGVTNGDDITAIFSCIATIASSAGTYPIVPTLVDPNDRRTNYNVSLVNGTLLVGQATPIITWSNPVPIPYGTALSSNQLNAVANVPGDFAYTPTNGSVLKPGADTLFVNFTPADALDYSSRTDSVSLVVTFAPITLNIELVSNKVTLNWNDPASVFALQGAHSALGVFTNIPGAASPHTNVITDSQQFFRLESQ